MPVILTTQEVEMVGGGQAGQKFHKIPHLNQKEVGGPS
jgi:hypothetical protein